MTEAIDRAPSLHVSIPYFMYVGVCEITTRRRMASRHAHVRGCRALAAMAIHSLHIYTESLSGEHGITQYVTRFTVRLHHALDLETHSKRRAYRPGGWTKEASSWNLVKC